MPVFVCNHILDHNAPALLVIHEEDGYQILCNQLHEGTTPEVMSLDDFLGLYPELNGIRFLKRNHLMERVAIDNPWVIEYNGCL
jgi:hypothetical protein